MIGNNELHRARHREELKEVCRGKSDVRGCQNFAIFILAISAISKVPCF